MERKSSSVPELDASKYGLVASPSWVLWVRGYGSWYAARSGEDRNELRAAARGYASVQILPMGVVPEADHE